MPEIQEKRDDHLSAMPLVFFTTDLVRRRQGCLFQAGMGCEPFVNAPAQRDWISANFAVRKYPALHPEDFSLCLKLKS